MKGVGSIDEILRLCGGAEHAGGCASSWPPRSARANTEERFLAPFVAAERGYIDEVIMPHATRRRVARP